MFSTTRPIRRAGPNGDRVGIRGGLSREGKTSRTRGDSPPQSDNLRSGLEAEAREITMFAEFARQAKGRRRRWHRSVLQRICDDKTERRAQFEAVLADN